MAFTGKPGTSSSKLGNIKLGITEVVSAPSPQAFGQAQAGIKGFLKKSGQAQASIKNTVRNYSQAQTQIDDTAYQGIVRESHPDSYLPLNDASGTTAIAGIGPNGTYSGSITYQINAPMAANAKNVGVSVAGIPSATWVETNVSDITNSFSFEVWYKTSSNTNIPVAESTSGVYLGALDSTGHDGTPNNLWWPTPHDSNRGVGVSVGINGIVVESHGSSTLCAPAIYSAPISETWHHLVIVVDVKVPKIYLDGILVHTGLTLSETIYRPTRLFGANSYGPFRGSANNSALYSTVLSADTILEHYNEGMPRGYGQAQASILRLFIQSGQAQAQIRAFGGFGQAQATLLSITHIFSGQAQAQILKSAGYGQAQADIKTQNNGFGQAQVQIRDSYPSGQVQAQIKGIGINKFAQVQTDIKQSNRGYGQAQCFIFTRTPSGQAQASINQSRRVAQAQADIKEFSLIVTVAQALIQVIRIGSAQTQAYIRVTSRGSGQARCFINRRQGYGQSQCFVALRKGSGQAQCRIKVTSTGSGNAMCFINRHQGYGQAQCAIKHSGSGQAQAKINTSKVGTGQAQVFINKNAGYGQSLASLHAITKNMGQAMAQIAKTAGYGQVRARIKRSVPSSGQAQCFIGHMKIGQAQAFINNDDRYFVNFNGFTLPGYAQSENYDSIMQIHNTGIPYYDGSLSEYFGLQNKAVSLRLKTVSTTFAGAKDQVQIAGTMLRSNRNDWAKLYVGAMDRYFLALTQKVTLENTAQITRSMDYTVDFETKPWIISDDIYEVSGTDLIETTNRVFKDGTWTPTKLLLSGTDITITGTTENGLDTGTIQISGVVSALTIDTDTLTVLMDGVSRNDLIINKDYSLFVGPGKTFFQVSGADLCVIQYNNRWLLPSNYRSTQSTATVPITPTPVPPPEGIGSGLARAYINTPTKRVFGLAQGLILSQTKQMYGQALADIHSTKKIQNGQTQAQIRQAPRGFGQAKADIKKKTVHSGQAQCKILGTDTGYPPDTTLAYVIEPSASLPGLLSPIIDPTWFTKITRVSNAGVRHNYARIPAWNCDQTKLLLGFSYPGRMLDGNTYADLGSFSQIGQAIWSSVDPNKFYGTDTNILYSQNATTGALTVLHTFSAFTTGTLGGYSGISIGDGEGGVDDNDTYIALLGQTSGGTQHLLTYNIQTDTIVNDIVLASRPNNCQISRKGTYVIVVDATTERYARDLTSHTTIISNGNHGDNALDDAGNEIYISNSAPTGVISIKLSTGTSTNLFPANGNHTYFDPGHTSGRCFGRNGWVYLSSYDNTYYGSNPTYPGKNQIIAVKTDGSAVVEVFGFDHHSDVGTYMFQPHAVPSPDGRKVMFASEWGTGSVYAFVAEMS